MLDPERRRRARLYVPFGSRRFMHYTMSPDAAFAAVEDGAVVLHMGTKRYYSLNETGTFVWRRLEESVARPDIVAQVVEEYDVGIAEAEIAVSRLLDELVQERLIRIAEPA